MDSDSDFRPHYTLLFPHLQGSHTGALPLLLHMVPDTQWIVPFTFRPCKSASSLCLPDHKYSGPLSRCHFHPLQSCCRVHKICMHQTYLIARERAEIFLWRFFHKIVYSRYKVRVQNGTLRRPSSSFSRLLTTSRYSTSPSG